MSKKLLAILAVIIMVIAAFSFVGCDNGKDDDSDTDDTKKPGNEHDFTVKIEDTNGNAFKGFNISVEACELIDGGGGICYTFQDADSDGMVYFDCGKNDIPETSKRLEFHICVLCGTTPVPAFFLDYDQSKANARKGESVTIKATENFVKKSGNGTGSYATGSTEEIDIASFEPYLLEAKNYDLVFGAAAYKVNFTSKDQKIYFDFQDNLNEGEYEICILSEASVKLTQLIGSKDTNLTNKGENNSVSGVGKSYKFTQSAEGDHNYFELMPNGNEDINKDVIVLIRLV